SRYVTLREFVIYFVETAIQFLLFFFQAEDGIRDATVTGVQTCALPIYWQSERWNWGTSRPRWCSQFWREPWRERARRNGQSLFRSEERRVGKECRSRWVTCY